MRWIEASAGTNPMGDFVFWGRVFGRGLWVGDTRPLFSEREGYVRSWRLGVQNWRIKYLPKEKA